MAKLYPQALGFLFVTSYDLQGYCGVSTGSHYIASRGPHRKRRIQQFFHCCVCICWNGHVFWLPCKTCSPAVLIKLFRRFRRPVTSLNNYHFHYNFIIFALDEATQLLIYTVFAKLHIIRFHMFTNDSICIWKACYNSTHPSMLSSQMSYGQTGELTVKDNIIILLEQITITNQCYKSIIFHLIHRLSVHHASYLRK
jgi:hypothetical protein